MPDDIYLTCAATIRGVPGLSPCTWRSVDDGYPCARPSGKSPLAGDHPDNERRWSQHSHSTAPDLPGLPCSSAFSWLSLRAAAYSPVAAARHIPGEKPTVIANDRIGWTAQAIILPVCFLAVAIIFGWIAQRLPFAARVAVAATVARHGGAAALAAHHGESAFTSAGGAAAPLAGHDPNCPTAGARQRRHLLPYTAVALAGIALMGAALALSARRPC